MQLIVVYIWITFETEEWHFYLPFNLAYIQKAGRTAGYTAYIKVGPTAGHMVCQKSMCTHKCKGLWIQNVMLHAFSLVVPMFIYRISNLIHIHSDMMNIHVLKFCNPIIFNTYLKNLNFKARMKTFRKLNLNKLSEKIER